MGSIISKRALTLTPAPNSTVITAASFSSSSRFSTQWQDLNYHLLATPTPTVTSFSSSAQWPDLSYDLLVSIFSRLSTVDLIVAVSAVCSSWRAAARDPHCWRILDLSDWESFAASIPDHVDFSQVFKRALALASDSGRIEKVFLPSIANGQDLILVSNRLPNLLYLSFSNHDFNRKDVCSAMTNFNSLMGIEAVENFFRLTIGAVFHLKSVFEIKILGERKVWRERKDCREGFIALLMCKVFPNLRKLEMSDLPINAQHLQNFHNEAQHHDISELTEAFKTAESLFS
ncbi:hypothetical protein LUZ60_001419 [Juncus effusus]|nr:hypothetical protein LUZ60_001419 [Juncus effusus]